ncbi:MAG: starch-binding protein [Ruminococcus sp.]|nr:starch-binding protein [Ruminococcus sp.]
MKVFFRKTPLWQNVSIFAWDEEYDPTFGDWPGTAMTNSFIGNDGEGNTFPSLYLRTQSELYLRAISKPEFSLKRLTSFRKMIPAILSAT